MIDAVELEIDTAGAADTVVNQDDELATFTL
jgi:hypothetical protein